MQRLAEWMTRSSTRHSKSSVGQLRTFARHLGLDERETREGIERITGSMLERTTRGSLSITNEWLNERLAGVPDARMLRLALKGNTARSIAVERLEQKLLSQFDSSQSKLIRRDLLQAEVREQAARFPVVFLIGHGGCGKTILAVQYLLEESATRLVMMVAASDATKDDCLGHELRELRSKDYFRRLPPDPIGRVIDRLRIANEDVEPPYLLVDLDGLDEISEDMRRGVRTVISQLRDRAVRSEPRRDTPVDLSNPIPQSGVRDPRLDPVMAPDRVSRHIRRQSW